MEHNLSLGGSFHLSILAETWNLQSRDSVSREGTIRVWENSIHCITNETDKSFCCFQCYSKEKLSLWKTSPWLPTLSYRWRISAGRCATHGNCYHLFLCLFPNSLGRDSKNPSPSEDIGSLKSVPDCWHEGGVPSSHPMSVNACGCLPTNNPAPPWLFFSSRSGCLTCRLLPCCLETSEGWPWSSSYCSMNLLDRSLVLTCVFSVGICI